MKTERLALAAVAMLIVGPVLASDLLVTSIDRNGTLTWTNTVSNAVYQVQWANSVTGPWTNFQSLAVLDAIGASNHVTTVSIPMFYRVLANTEPELGQGGLYRYTGYDPTGGLQVVGWWEIELTNKPSAGSFIGTWQQGYARRLQFPVSMGDLALGDQFGEGELSGSFYPGGGIAVNLNRWSADDNVYLRGEGGNGRYTGIWEWHTLVGPVTNGTFLLERAEVSR